MKRVFFFLVITAFAIGCSQSEAQEKKTTPAAAAADDPMKVALEGDPKAKELYTKAESAEKAGNKDAQIKTYMEFANYMMFTANVPPRAKYRPALKMYRKVLALDPKNDEAIKNKAQIEEIYKMMGRDVPQD
jgi:tetratricopeptide (TPR) repeat protein